MEHHRVATKKESSIFMKLLALWLVHNVITWNRAYEHRIAHYSHFGVSSIENPCFFADFELV